MLDIYSQFRDFHVFKKFKYLLGDWWDIDILVVVKRKDQFFYDNLNQLNNPVVKNLLSSSLFRNYFLKSIHSLLDKKLETNTELKKLPWKQTGLNLFIVPLVLKNKPLEAVLVATGFAPAPHNQEKLFQALSYLNLSEQAIEQKTKNLKALSPTDNVYVEKMLQILAEEFFALLQERKKQDEIIKVLNRSQGRKKYGSIVGKSPAMYYLFNALEKIKKHDVSLLIEGEKGTGKRLLAKNIHEQSLRSDAPFYSYNCSNFKGRLLELELFGYAKGAFPKASKEKKALLEKLDGGTLVLNNIGDSQAAFQQRLLKYLTDFVFFNEGSSKIKTANVRILALTKKDLKVFSEQGEFNKELYLALSGIHLKIPALRQRKTDIPALVDYFLKEKSPIKKKGFSVKAMKALYQYSWPGNVQELENEVDRVLALNTDNQDFFKFEDLSLHIRTSSSQWAKIFQDKKQNLKETLRSVEKKILMDCLRQNNWNKAKVARLLGTSRTSIISKSKEYGLIKKEGA